MNRGHPKTIKLGSDGNLEVGRIEQYFCSSGEGKKESPRRTGELPKTVMLIEGNRLVILGVYHERERGGSSIQCFTGGIRQQSRP